MNTDYSRLYLHLFNRCSDALESIERGKTDNAKQIIKTAQKECEEMYLGSGKTIYFNFPKP